MPSLRSTEPDDGVAQRRRTSRDVSSRYLATPSSVSSVSSSSSSSSSSSLLYSASAKRCPSPLVSATILSKTVAGSAKRSQSVERKRTGTPRPDVTSREKEGVSSVQRILFTSAKSMSVSFQGEAFSLPVSRAKPSPFLCNTRRGTPERSKASTTQGKTTNPTENSKPSDPHLWPRPRPKSCTTIGADYPNERRQSSGSGNRVIRALQNSVLHNRAISDGRPSLDLANDKKNMEDNGNFSVSTAGLKSREIFASDAERISSARIPSGCVISTKNGPATSASAKRATTPKKFHVRSLSPSPNGNKNNIQTQIRQASPSKFTTPALTPLRGISPSKGRRVAGGLSSNLCLTPSVLSFTADVRRANVGEGQVVDAHLLRLLYNTLLQWRFVNARGHSVLSVQKLNSERTLYNAWLSISRLHDSVREKRKELQTLQGSLKLVQILKGQMTYLEEWCRIERDQRDSLAGAIDSLKASSIRLPVVGGAVANAQSVKDAICCAVDVMQSMASSVCVLLPMVEEASSLATELIEVNAKERAMLNQCKLLLSIAGATQVKECSMKAQIQQLQRTK